MAKGPRNPIVDFGNESLPHFMYGGAHLLHQFSTRIELNSAIARKVRVAESHNRYSVGETLLAVLYPMIRVRPTCRARAQLAIEQNLLFSPPCSTRYAATVQVQHGATRQSDVHL
jgi:hypothetical protein